MEGIGAVGGGGDGEADVFLAEEGAEADEGIGEAVRVADAAFEKLMLASLGGAGGEREAETGDGAGKLEMFEMGGERAEEGVGRVGGLGQTDPVVVGRVTLEIEEEIDFRCRTIA